MATDHADRTGAADGKANDDAGSVDGGASRRSILAGLGTLGAGTVAGTGVASAGEPPAEAKYPNVIEPALQFGEYGTDLGRFIDPMDVAIGPDEHFYVLDKGNHRIQQFDEEGSLVDKWGSLGEVPMQFSAPESLAVSDDGVIFVADTANYRVQAFTVESEFLRSWGTEGTDEGEFARMEGIAVDSSRVYVADAGDNQVKVFDRDGTFEFEVGGYGSDAGEFNQPVSVDVDDEGAFYVADSMNHRIQKFDARGEFVTEWGEYGSLNGKLADPTGVSVQGDEVFVTDTINHRMQVFTRDGEYSYQWGRHPATPERAHADDTGRTHYPKGLEASSDGSYVLVCEPFENRIKQFEMAELHNLEPVDDHAWWEKGPNFHYGTTAIAASTTMAVAEPDTHSVVLFDIADVMPESITRFGGYGSELGEFVNPTGVGLDLERERMYTSDKGNHRIQIGSLASASMGKVTSALGEYGTEPGKFREPSGLDVDDQGMLFAVDNVNNRIQVFDPDLEVVRTWGEKGSDVGQFNQPLNIQLGPDQERVYVVDSFNYRIQVFDREGNVQFTWGEPGATNEKGEGRFVWPFGLEVGVDDYVYVSDPGGQRIQKFDLEGNFVTEWGEFGSEPGQFYKPKGISMGEDEMLYVMDFGNHRGQIFEPDGTFVDTYGVDEFQPADNSLIGGVAGNLIGGIAGLGSVGLLGAVFYFARRANGEDDG